MPTKAEENKIAELPKSGRDDFIIAKRRMIEESRKKHMQAKADAEAQVKFHHDQICASDGFLQALTEMDQELKSLGLELPPFEQKKEGGQAPPEK